MSDIPDDAIGRRVKQVMERNGEFDHAQAGAEVAAGHGNRIDRLCSQFVGDLSQLVRPQGSEFARIPDGVQQRCLRHHFLFSAAAYPLPG